MSFSPKFIQSQVVFLFCLGVLAIGYKSLASQSGLPTLDAVQPFELISQDEKAFGLKDLKGKIWVADFIFTTCSDICPMMSRNMSSLARAHAHDTNLRFVSITVNPENDLPKNLKAYLTLHQADTRWSFLTGNREDIQKLAVESFKLGDMKEIVFHSSMFVLVDRQGLIRGYYDGKDAERKRQLSLDILKLKREVVLPLLPSINALLNGMAGLMLILGFMAIRRQEHKVHQRYMIAALCCSVLFLGFYLYYHFTTHLITRYAGEGWIKAIYFFILGTHTPLAVMIIPFILMAVWQALKGDFEKHKRITRWLYPAWLYVSLTGVLIYLMLYVFRSA